EELTTNNEELIINNEELTTSNEELIINNEELTTSNEELIINNEELRINNELENAVIEIGKIRNQFPLKPLLIVGNKADKLTEAQKHAIAAGIPEMLFLSAKEGTGVEELKDRLLSFVNTGALRNNETIVTNTRHYDSLLKALEEIQKVNHGLQMNLSSDLMAIDIREALYHFGEITGQVTNDELLGNIFANFCIGK
ncbi:MAG: hypothetical protein CFE23_08420, partial [Flavobacterium sp. BFFFF1]